MSEQYVIGEGVILDARPTSFMVRALACAIDWIIYLIAATIILITLIQLDLFSQNFGAQMAIIAVVTFFILLPMTVETLTRGRSIGKWALGISVVRDDGGPIGLRQAFIRASTGFGELWLTVGSVAIVAAISNDRGKRIGDMLAGTYVIRVRAKKSKSLPLEVPTPLVGWISNAEISKLPDGLAVAARQFLERRWKMNPVARETMARNFRAQLTTRVAPNPPFFVPDEEYILAVIAERSSRESVLETTRLERATVVQAQMDKLPYGIR